MPNNDVQAKQDTGRAMGRGTSSDAGPIRPEDIHPTIQYICARLTEHGHEVLVVGGAVRDLLLGRRPKDFDLATSARPEAVKRLFRNARIIGRRFRLVLLRYPDMTVEVSTFRSEAKHHSGGIIKRDNRYGTWGEDAFRRDFTINALALDPETMEVLDPVGAIADLEAKCLRTIKPPKESFTEDPVRMLRAVRFQVRLGFKIDSAGLKAIKGQKKLLAQVSRHRLADEMQRFLTHPQAPGLFEGLAAHGLLDPLLCIQPHAWFFAPKVLRDPFPVLRPLLERYARWELDVSEPPPPTVALLGLLVTLATDKHRQWLLGKEAVPRESLGPFKNKLGAMLAQWGLLNGQVGPALAILNAARAVLNDPERFAPAAGRDAAYLLGIREAWLLLNSLRDVIGVPQALLDAGLERLGEMPDLPILDHPRPKKRGTPPARLEHTVGMEGGGLGAKKRRRRRGRRKGTASRPS